MKEITEKEAYNKAAMYCSRCEHCSSEVIQKLNQWGMMEGEIQQRIIHKLQEENYIDESRYCHAFVHDKFHFNHWGRQKIAMHLSHKKLPSLLIKQALDEVSDDESLQTAKTLLFAKLQKTKADTPYDLYTKLMRFASSRGIEMEIARTAIKQLLKDVKEDCDIATY